MAYRYVWSLMVLMTIAQVSGTAQSAIDALRYNSNGQIGTARNISVGGSMGSMGADMSIFSTNPAGLARYKSTVFQISPNIGFGNTSGNYLSNRLEDEYLTFNSSSLGAVFAKQNNNNDWRSFSAGASLNRLNSYVDDIFISGTNTNNSLLDLHAAVANGTDPSIVSEIYPFDAGLTYLGELLTVDTNLIYSSILGDISPKQDITISRSGGKQEASIGGGGNYKDKIYVGASIGIPIINFDETEFIVESDANDEVNSFNYFDIRNELRTSGYGVNFKFGILGRPHQFIRLGAAFHTPSLINIEEQYLTVVNADYDTVAYEVTSPDGLFEYRLVNPWKFIGNVGFLLGKYGFISAEYELQNPGDTKFKFKSNDADIIREQDIRNNQINSLYDWQHHLKVGLEIKLDPIRIRGGVQYKSSPFASGGDAVMTYSGGLGYRGKHFFIDGAYSFTATQSEFTPYEFGSISSGSALLNHNRSQVTITIGAKL